MIDFTALRNLASELAVISVGHMLSTFDASGNPAVIREYSATDKPAYPFMTYDVRWYGTDHQRPVNSYFDSEDRYCSEYLEKIDIKYCCKGDKAQEIISQLYDYLLTPTTRERVSARVQGLSILSLTTPRMAPVVYGTQYVEDHSFIVKLNYMNKVIDKFAKPIDGAEITGCVIGTTETTTFTFDIPT